MGNGTLKMFLHRQKMNKTHKCAILLPPIYKNPYKNLPFSEFPHLDFPFQFGTILIICIHAKIKDLYNLFSTTAFRKKHEDKVLPHFRDSLPHIIRHVILNTCKFL